MRYTIENKDGAEVETQLAKWQEDGKIVLEQEGQRLIEMQKNLGNIAQAFELLKKSGYSEKIMKSFILQETKVSRKDLDKVLAAQNDFFRYMGVKI